MEHYERIPGWFDFADIYDDLIARARDGAVFVEVGAYLGRSSLYLASRIQWSGKKIRVYVVDRWDGWIYHDCFARSCFEQEDEKCSESEDVFWHFIRNVRRAGVEDVICPLKMPSEQAASLFEDGSLDFVFLDADHGYEAVRRDLEAWFPKVKRRGVLGGHDYLHPDFPGVRRAADEFFMRQELPVQVHGTSFLATKPSPRWLNAALRAYRSLVPAG
ncbi:MAG TPA: class I SAM-dependent methyltransferase [Gemmataceae bacterium]|nr:class I SAM-dependent methyltransferase [Gemmataceae bacterium]